MIYRHTKYYVTSYNGPSVTVFKWKVNIVFTHLLWHYFTFCQIWS